jgi:hypothetical protein
VQATAAELGRVGLVDAVAVLCLIALDAIDALPEPDAKRMLRELRAASQAPARAALAERLAGAAPSAEGERDRPGRAHRHAWQAGQQRTHKARALHVQGVRVQQASATAGGRLLVTLYSGNGSPEGHRLRTSTLDGQDRQTLAGGPGLTRSTT